MVQDLAIFRGEARASITIFPESRVRLIGCMNATRRESSPQSLMQRWQPDLRTER